ncbi:helix-turn-helix domain-containing protein [Tengunoibacter tsumagoiensis]|uniref:HTH cro/C1-type domain-containing protein n=1 Tax=Tengunoibacter tsumagoiensis TaxID=2014871 RepID=A0A402A9C1_9CHLR|nr:helix-turn-helix domain-containing protein [Tengunoibacter tsumagoiensis]GCE15698.1 hypothetical protein KTT_55570 [Tengunoibacter tsumagoiensis]
MGRAPSQPNERLRQERLIHGWTQSDVAGYIGTDGYTINRWERGRARPSPHFRQKLCALFGKGALELGLVPTITGPRQESDVSDATFNRYWNVPYQRNRFFSGHEKLLSTLHPIHSSTAAVIPTDFYALYGMPGSGKTQLAVEFAYRYASSYQAIFWVEAGTEEQIRQSYLAIAEMLQLPVAPKKGSQHLVASVHRWLSMHKQWLLIWDNLRTRELLQRFLSPTLQGTILFTTRLPTLGALAVNLEVAPLKPEEGAQLLLRYSGLLHPQSSPVPIDYLQSSVPAEYQAAYEIAELLGGLPLALAQVGAYLEETPCDIVDYLHLYHTGRVNPFTLCGLNLTHYPHSVASIYCASFAEIASKSTGAMDLLRLCAFLAPNDIPEEIFIDGAAFLGERLASMAQDPLLLYENISILYNSSLLTRNKKKRTLTLYALVQRILQDTLSEELKRLYLKRVIQALSTAFAKSDPIVASPFLCERYLPHIQVCATLSARYDLHLPDMGFLLHQVEAYQGHHHGYYAKAACIHLLK